MNNEFKFQIQVKKKKTYKLIPNIDYKQGK